MQPPQTTGMIGIDFSEGIRMEFLVEGEGGSWMVGVKVE
jgi:hypothetical protein